MSSRSEGLLEGLLLRPGKFARMLERDRVIEIVTSIAAVSLFVAVLVAIGSHYNQGGIGPEGGLVLLGSIVGFVLLMGAMGIFLAFYLDHEDE